ncbi:MAG: glycosyltransferase [Clostridia bacterium]|nr:glycosyltransferase [Clostridia bacterium]
MNKLTPEQIIKRLMAENEELKENVKQLEADLSYCKLYYGNELEKINFERFLRLNYYFMRQNGVWAYVKEVFRAFGKFFRMGGRKVKKLFTANATQKELKAILKEHKGKKIMLYYPGYDWGMKMYQRPQHMAIHFAKEDYLFFYCTINAGDSVNGFEKIADNLYVTNLYEMLRDKLPRYTLYMCANMNGCFLDELEPILARGNKLLYEYIDDLHEDLTVIPPELIERHKFVLADDSIPVVATAQYLFEKAAKLRGSTKNILQSTNGVVYEDFHITKTLPVPEKIEKMVAEGKPIIGYYGALAKWFDYELVQKSALAHPEWNFLLIGIDYDQSFAEYNYFKDLENVDYIGIVDYKELINYGNCCAVLTIPFVINEITLSTSPVKVFEYMSMEKPIVTTALPECKKYKSVLIGRDHDDYLKKLELAVKSGDNETYRNMLREEALENTWENKVREIISCFYKK